MSEMADEGPDWRRNLLRGRLRDAATTAEASLAQLRGPRGASNPTDSLAEEIELSWYADTSPTRDRFIADVLGVGEGIRSTFDGTAQDLWDAANAEEEWIDVEALPHEEWKTSTSRLDGRVDMRSRGYA